MLYTLTLKSQALAAGAGLKRLMDNARRLATIRGV